MKDASALVHIPYKESDQEKENKKPEIRALEERWWVERTTNEKQKPERNAMGYVTFMWIFMIK